MSLLLSKGGGHLFWLWSCVVLPKSNSALLHQLFMLKKFQTFCLLTTKITPLSTNVLKLRLSVVCWCYHEIKWWRHFCFQRTFDRFCTEGMDCPGFHTLFWLCACCTVSSHTSRCDFTLMHSNRISIQSRSLTNLQLFFSSPGAIYLPTKVSK